MSGPPSSLLYIPSNKVTGGGVAEQRPFVAPLGITAGDTSLSILAYIYPLTT